MKWRKNIAENFNRLSRAHERYRQTTDDRQTDGRRHIANVFAKNEKNMASSAVDRTGDDTYRKTTTSSEYPSAWKLASSQGFHPSTRTVTDSFKAPPAFNGTNTDVDAVNGYGVPGKVEDHEPEHATVLHADGDDDPYTLIQSYIYSHYLLPGELSFASEF